MNPVQLPPGFRWERLARNHRRKQFRSGASQVDEWLQRNAWQQQRKQLSATTVLLDAEESVVGYYTLATGQIDFSNLPVTLSKSLPRRLLPVAVLAWLGVATSCQGRGLGRRLLAKALRDCYAAGTTFPFVAVILDCIDDQAKQFYQHWDFRELPGHPYRLYLGHQQLKQLMEGE